MPDFQTIFYEPSPDGTCAAIVEQDDRVAYFYLHGTTDDKPSKSATDRPALQACWLRNLIPGPIAFDVNEMQQGIPPILPRLHCEHPEGLDPLEEERLGVIWFEEGGGAAITYDDQIEAIIPPWSGLDGFHGFSYRCKSPNQVCWPLPRDRSVFERLDEAKRFWEMWNNGQPWPSIQKSILDRYEQLFGQHLNYYAIDGNRWPPKAIGHFRSSGVHVYLTIGLSIRPQPSPTPNLVVPPDYRRIELGFAAQEPISENAQQRILQLLSSAANYPWHAQYWLAPGHTYPFDAEDVNLEPNQLRFPRVILTDDERIGPPVRNLRFHTDAVRLLWMTPICDVEVQLLDQSGPPTLIERLAGLPNKAWSENRQPCIVPAR